MKCKCMDNYNNAYSNNNNNNNNDKLIIITIIPIIINMIHRYITFHYILLNLIIIKRMFCADVSKKKVNVPRQK